MGALSEALFFARRHREILGIYRIRARWPLRVLLCCLLVTYALLYPLLVFIHILRAPRSAELGFLERLRFHWNRPLTLPHLEGGGYNFLEYLRHQPPGTASFDDSKLGWRRRFLECGLRTPDLFLVIDDATPPDAARDIPPLDIVVKRNCGGRGKGVTFYRYDPRTALYAGSLTAEDIVRRARSVKLANLEDNSSLVIRAIEGSPRMPHGEYRQHLRCITVKRGPQPVLFRAMSFVQFDKSVFATNHAAGARVFNVTSGALDGSPVLHFDEAVSGCLAVHRRLEFVSIAWDLVVAEDGPYFLEGNVNHGVYWAEYPDFYSVLRDYYEATGLLAPAVTARLSRNLTGHLTSVVPGRLRL